MPTTPSPLRNRTLSIAVACVFAALALASRRYGAALPPFVASYAGDTLWATMVFFATGAVMARWSSPRVAALALAGSYAVEASQLYQAPWIFAVRQTTVGGLILGHGFLWTDIACYTAGVMLGWALERLKTSRESRHHSSNIFGLSPRGTMSDERQSFEQFLKDREAAARAYVQGDAGPLGRIVTREHPATFFGPQGGVKEGAEEVASTYERDAHAFESGSETTFEILHSAADGGVGYWTGYQRANARMQGQPEPIPMVLRVTEVFRLEGGEWKMVHRHADTQASAPEEGKR